MDQSHATLAGQYHHKYHHKHLLFLLNAYKISNTMKKKYMMCHTLDVLSQINLELFSQGFLPAKCGKRKRVQVAK